MNQTDPRGGLMELQPVLPALEKYAPTRAATLRKKSDDISRRVSELENLINPNAARFAELQQAQADGSPDALLNAAAKVPGEYQNYYVMQAARQAIAKNDLETARKIIKEQISDADQRAELNLMIDRQVLEQSLRQGEIERARQLAASIKSPEERSNMLARLAIRAADVNNREAARQLLAEARLLVGTQAANLAQLNAQLWVAHASINIEPTQAFEMLNASLDRLNELAAAALTLDGFTHQGVALEDGEMRLQNHSVINLLFHPYINLLNSIGRADFDRTRAAVDRIQRLELRLLAQLQLAEGILRPQGINTNPNQLYGDAPLMADDY